MQADDQWLLDLARCAGDRQVTGWRQAEAGAASDRDRDIVRALSLIAQISHFRWQQAETRTYSQDPSSREQPKGSTAGSLGRWRQLELLEKIGEGGFAEVFRANDLQLERQVALKLLRPHRAQGESTDAVLHEARLLAKIRHPNIANVYGAATEGDRMGFWMELVEGKPLTDLLATQGILGAREATLIGIDLCGALAAVHAQGVIHRDVKAENVIREDGGRVLLIDFGIGRSLRQERLRPEPSGTPLYLAPEVLAGRPASASSDIYSLGVLLFHLVSGRFPIEGDSLAEIKELHRTGRSNLLRDLRPDSPPLFVTAIDGALALEPTRRFSSAGQFERVLSQALEQSSITANAETRGTAKHRHLPRAWRIARPIVLASTVVLGLWLVVTVFCKLQFGAAPLAITRYLQAESAYRQDQNERALRLIDDAIDRSPDFAKARLARSVYLTSLNRHHEASQEVAHAYSLRRHAGTTASALIELSYFNLRLDYERAIESIRTVPGHYRDPYAQRQIATLHSRLGKRADALRSIDRAIELDSEDFKNVGRKLILLVEDEQPERAAQLFAKHRHRITPQSGGFYLYWGAGLAQLHLGDDTAARELFELMEAGGGTFAENAQLLQARRLILGGRLSEASDLLHGNKARISSRVEHTDHSIQAYWTAWLHFLNGDRMRAVAALQAMTRRLDPQAPIHARRFRNAAFLYFRLGEWEAAAQLVPVLSRMQELSRSSVIRAFDLQLSGEMAELAGDRRRAAEQFEEARRLHSDGSILWSLARHYELHGEVRRAAEIYRVLTEMKGRLLRHDEFVGLWPLAHSQRARCLRRLGLHQQAARSASVFHEAWGTVSPPLAADLFGVGTETSDLGPSNY